MKNPINIKGIADARTHVSTQIVAEVDQILTTAGMIGPGGAAATDTDGAVAGRVAVTKIDANHRSGAEGTGFIATRLAAAAGRVLGGMVAAAAGMAAAAGRVWRGMVGAALRRLEWRLLRVAFWWEWQPRLALRGHHALRRLEWRLLRAAFWRER